MGRTPSAGAHRKVLAAALELVAERGVDATSMDAIAEASGVSKATIYKHWADKDALLLELMADLHGLQKRPTFDTGNTRADMIAVLAYRPPEAAEMRERILPHFVAHGARNPAFGDAWRRMAMDPPRRELKHLMSLGIEKGELTPDLDLDFSLALLLGPVLYWHVFLRRTAADVQALAAAVTDAFWRAFGRERIDGATLGRDAKRRLRRSPPRPIRQASR